MACQARFEPTVPIDCIKELVSDIRSGSFVSNINATIGKALWSAGCVNAILTANQPTILAASKAACPVFTNVSHAASALEEYCDTFEKNCHEADDPNLPIMSNEVGPILKGVQLDPQLVGFILQAIQYLLGQFFRSN